VLEVIAVLLERLDHLDDAGAALRLRVLALQRLVAFHHRRQDRVQHFVGCRLELAVLHDVGDLRVDLATERIVLRGAHPPVVNGGERRVDCGADARHARAQRFVARPLATVVERQRRRVAGPVGVRMTLRLGGGRRGVRIAVPVCRRLGRRRGLHRESERTGGDPCAGGEQARKIAFHRSLRFICEAAPCGGFVE